MDYRQQREIERAARKTAPTTFFGGGLGAVIGGLLFGPPGAAIGAGIGGFIGSSADEEADKRLATRAVRQALPAPHVVVLARKSARASHRVRARPGTR